MIYKPLIFYWRKPKTPVYVWVPKFKRSEEVVMMRGVQFSHRWFVGIYTFAEPTEGAAP